MRFSSLLLLTCVLATPLMANGPNDREGPEGAVGGQPSASTPSASAADWTRFFFEQGGIERYQMIKAFKIWWDQTGKEEMEASSEASSDNLPVLRQCGYLNIKLLEGEVLFCLPKEETVLGAFEQDFPTEYSHKKINSPYAKNYALGFGRALFDKEIFMSRDLPIRKVKSLAFMAGVRFAGKIKPFAENWVSGMKLSARNAKEVDAQGAVVD